MSNDRKIAEGLECIRQAEKCLKTSFLKWKPDYDGAADEFTKAATNFRNAKALQQCKDCLMRASECYRLNQSYFSAAKSIEQAALVTKDMGDFLEAANLVEKACRSFQEHGVPDTAALSLDKGAKIIEGKHPERALILYLKAAEVVSLEDRPRQVAEYLGKAARLQVKLKKMDDAAETMFREMEMHEAAESRAAVGRMVVALVIVHLTRGDYVAAEKVFREKISYVEDEEVHTLVALLEAFDQEDPEAAARALKSPFLKYMDVEYAKLARDLKVPSSIVHTGEVRAKNQRDSGVETIHSPSSYEPPAAAAPAPVPKARRPSRKLSEELGSLTLSPETEQPPVEKPAAARPPPAAPVKDEDDEYGEGLC